MAEAVKEVARKTKDNLSSMLQDLANNKRTEVEIINGVKESQARRLGMSAPVNRWLTQLVLSLERKNRKFTQKK
ncbi:hypothetical protein X474_02545 [Dethiosulfatarculus sandiegensis]|uniref:Ketopantoate reductase C-terminal domain-containing protein n=1 Tax=Dethiosulfatarculus sandiegensis TaxID=1429043 RepID=A0A0D2K208_9BACT|nr:hypothetical protein X474_02545 [Dethiosulfatarculus sandiegensis]